MADDDVLLSWNVSSQRQLVESLRVRKELFYAFVGLVFIYVFFPVFVTRINITYGGYLFAAGFVVVVYTYFALMHGNEVRVELTDKGIRIYYVGKNDFTRAHLKYFSTRRPFIRWEDIERYFLDMENLTAAFTLSNESRELIKHFQGRNFVIVANKDTSDLLGDVLEKNLPEKEITEEEGSSQKKQVASSDK
ncbi:MAG: hypothetical protein ABH950_05975 [Candidatus Altiarchaeota archaeon]